MGFRFSKRIKVNNLISLNVSKTGVSATVGKKGASVNLGSKGAFLNLGLKGTGLSYRTKILDNPLKKNNKKDTKVKKADKVKEETVNTAVNAEVDTTAIQEYEEALYNSMNLHRELDVDTKEEYAQRIVNFTNPAEKEIYQLALDGDEDTIETLIGSYMNNMEANYAVNASYELEDHILYFDLDLPEIEDLDPSYPALNNNKLVSRNKTQLQLREEYAKNVLSLGVWLGGEMFNISSYIEQIVFSAYTQKRNNDGDLADEYLYSVKFNRDVFEKTDFAELDDVYKFIQQFENRINMNNNYVFKAISPYQMPEAEVANSLISEAVEGLKGLGYKQNEINNILPALSNMQCQSSGEYLKQGLKLLMNN